MHLGLLHEHKIEDVRSTMVARLLWSKSHEGLPQKALQEEPLDALLIRVEHCLVCNAAATMFQHCFDEYLPLLRRGPESWGDGL